MKKLTLLLIFGSLFFTGFSPEPSDYSFSTDAAMENSYKAEVVKGVFNRLKMAKGDFRSRRPYLRFVKDNPNGPASAYPKKGLIILEEDAYDICREFGKDSLNALAAFLGHELIHCYENHDWEAHFAKQFKSDTDIGGIKDKDKDDEIQADYLGGFLTYQAGFKTFGLMEKFLDKVYKFYNLKPENMKNKYPPKEERAEMAKKSALKLKRLIEVFEAGNLLAVTGQHRGALDYYDRVLEDFQSREIYNNLGVVMTLAAMDEMSEKQLKSLDFPVELDLYSRAGTRTINDDPIGKLMDAIDLFEKARKFDSFYAPAYLNEGCARALLGILDTDFSDLEWSDAEGMAKRAIKLGEKSEEFSSTHSDALVLLGNLEVLRGNQKEAKKFYKEALDLNPKNLFALSNKKTLSSTGGASGAIKDSVGFIEDKEVIDGLSFGNIKLRAADIKDTIRQDPDAFVRLAVQSQTNSKVLADVSVRGSGGTEVKSISIIHLTGPGYEGTSGKGIKIGDSLKTVMKKYGEPEKKIALGSGTFLRYQMPEERALIFEFDYDGKVNRWAIFKKQ